MEYVNIQYINTVTEKENCDLDKINNAKKIYSSEEAALLKRCNDLFILVDFDFNVIGNPENYWAAKESTQKVVPCRRVATVAKNADFPPRIQLELTSICNIECIMCPRSEQFLRPRKHMDWDMFTKSIDEIAKFGILQLQLFHIGESLLNPLFFDMMDYIAQYDNLGAKWLSSNGNVLNERIISKLLKTPIDFLNISLNSTTKEVYEEICFESDYNIVLENLDLLTKLKKESGQRKPVVRIQMIDQPLTNGQLEDFLDDWGDKGDLLSINKLEAFGGQVSKNVTYSADRLSLQNSEKFCKRLDRGDFYILSNGEVTFCDTDYNNLMSLGNVMDKSIKEIWDGPEYRRVRELADERNYDELALCKTCTDWDL